MIPDRDYLPELEQAVREVTGLDRVALKHCCEPCLLWLLGKRCKRSLRGGPCEGHPGGRWKDHPTTWTGNRRTVAIVSQPYPPCDRDVAELEAACGRLGLVFTVTPVPFYHHPRVEKPQLSNTIIITRAGGVRL